MDKLLVLGSDYFTKQVVIEGKNIGAYVIVADLMETSPTKTAADEQWLISTTDIDTLGSKCIEAGVTAVLCGASDFNTNNVRQLCKRLDLPLYCSSDYAWGISRNKGDFKKVCKSVGAPVAEDYFISDINNRCELDKVCYPVVVKPVDKSGNRGVSYCYNEKELIAAYNYAKEISDNEQVIVERMLKGTEHNVCYIVADGEPILSSYDELHHHPEQLANIYSFEINTKRFLKQFIEEVNDSLKNVFRKIGCTEGVVWVDSMRDETDGKFYILEMGYRFPAALASCALNEKATGINPVRWMVECALGIKHRKEDAPSDIGTLESGKVALIHLFTTKAGVINKIIGLEKIETMENVTVDMPKREGSVVREHTCIALITVYADNCPDICERIKEINETIRIENEKGENMVVIYDDYDAIRRKG